MRLESSAGDQRRSMAIGPTATNETPPFYRGVLGTPFFDVASRGEMASRVE
jgi:hypothetical protein